MPPSASFSNLCSVKRARTREPLRSEERRVGHERRSGCWQAVDGIRDYKVTGVQTCALPISSWIPGVCFSISLVVMPPQPFRDQHRLVRAVALDHGVPGYLDAAVGELLELVQREARAHARAAQIGRASRRARA